jgi:DNA-cytosine methyltransferase
MNILSLFDGISCGRLALEKLNIKPEKYYSSEIDKYAIKISESNYDDIIRLGDVKNWQSWDIDFSKIDLLLSGFPCQAWSVAGKQKGLLDERGQLGVTNHEIFEHIKKLNPNVKFLFENVRMKKENLEFFDNLFSVKHTMINSALVSAQNRVRCYWTNLGDKIPQPDDKGILLKDIIEHGEVDRDKSYCVDANYFKGGSLKNYLEKARRQIVFNYSSSGRGDGKVEDRANEAQKAGTLTATGYTNRSFTGVATLRPCKPKGLKKESLCHHVADATDIKGNQSIKRVYSKTGKAPTLTTMTGGHREPKILAHEWEYRKLTPLECERLQTMPDNWTLVTDNKGNQLVSNSQRYKAIGNAWTVDVIAHILENLK